MRGLDAQLALLLNGMAGQSPFLDGAIVFLASYLAYGLLVLLLVFALLSSYLWREKMELLLIAGVSALVARFGVAEFIRLFYHRPRPFTDLPVDQLLTSTEWSFPSGHATFFFALATAVYLYNKKWGITFFIMTILMTISRVIVGIHYPLDILGGAIIGIGVGCATFYLVRTVTTAPPTHENTTATY